MKKILSILLVIMLIISFVQIRNMYALYKDKLSGEYETSLGKWNVKVNGTDIVSPGNVVEFNMTDKNIRYGTSDYVLSGANVIAPNTEAFFDILIDTYGTEVAVKYNIEIGETVESAATGDTLVGQITSYRLLDHENDDAYIVDNTDDDIDDAANDYLFDVPCPIRFEVVSVEDSFGSYTIDSTTGEITGTESTTEVFTKINGISDTKNIGMGVIPLNVSQRANEADKITDKVSIKFKWVSDEESMAAEEKEAVEDMYKYFADLNEENKKIEFVVPIKVTAIQYFGENL